jgi:hypothetical protein
MLLSKNVIDLENGNYNFSDYFKMNIAPENLAKVFGYTFRKDIINFEKNKLNDDFMAWIKEFYNDFLKLNNSIDFCNETAKREFLISPVILKLIKNINIKVKIEEETYYDNTLKGKIDYILNNDKNIIVAIEAKNSDMEKGLNQLIAELIAIDKILEDDNKNDFIYGAVTIGFDWRFIKLDRINKIIIQDINYLSIKELEEILQILVGILE